jgi:hypothetical protein
MFGLFSLIASLISLVFWLFILAVIGLFIAKAFIVDKHSEDSVVQRWGTLLDGQQDKGSEFLKNVEDVLRLKNLPFEFHRERIATSFTSGELYDFVVCRLSDDYSCFYGYVPMGNDLTLNWILQDHMIKGIYKVPILGQLLLSIFKRYSFAMTNKEIAFASVTQQVAIEAAEKLMDLAKLDKSKLNRKSSGKLGPL